MVKGKATRILASATMSKIMKKAGAERISDDAQERLAEVLEQIGINIAKNAILFAKHTGRKTIKAADIALASK